MSGADAYTRVYAAVRRIPPGRVATYGQIAALAGLPGHARQVGYALHALKAPGVPWHRVINVRGRISARAYPGADVRQRHLLEKEGVLFDANGRISLADFGWHPRTSRVPIGPIGQTAWPGRLVRHAE